MPHRVTELHNIMPLSNIPSVLKNGILSHHLVRRLPHASVALEEVQDRRHLKNVPGGLRLHDYANLYFCARNPMMFCRKNQCQDLCVIRVSKNILITDGVVISDRNAASDYARFFKSPEGLRHLDYNLIFATYWNHDDYFEYMKRKSVKCAEALVPHSVPVEQIVGAYVVSSKAASILQSYGFPYPITQNTNIFFA